MATILVDIQSRIERSLYQAIRSVIVEHGYLPNIDLYPNTPAGYQAWELAKGVIADTKGFCVELFNHSANLSKGAEKVPRIVITTRQVLPGGIGNGPNYDYTTKLSGQYTGVRIPPLTNNFLIEISLVSGTAEQDRILHAIIGASLTTRKYLRFYDLPLDTQQRFLIVQRFHRDMSFLDQGTIKKAYVYEVLDLYLSACEEVGTFAAIKEICLDICIQNGSTLLIEASESLCITEECDLLWVDSNWVDCDWVE